MKKLTHFLSSAELDAIEAHLQFLSDAAIQGCRPGHSSGLKAARAYLATTRLEAFQRRAKQRAAKLRLSIPLSK